MITRQSILTIEKLVFVNLNAQGVPEPYGYNEITYNRDRLPSVESHDTRRTALREPGTPATEVRN